MVGANTQGPGRFIARNESMSPRAAAYQQQITGNPSNIIYLVNGVSFDGFVDGVLVDAKGLGYAKFTRGGRFRDWFSGADDLLDQAIRQLNAAGETPIRWEVAEPEAVTAIMNLFRDNGIAGIGSTSPLKGTKKLSL